MTHETLITEQQEAQRPDLGIERIKQGEGVIITSEQLSWLTESVDVATVRVTLETGHSFLYGSVVSANNTLRKLASDVPPEKSRQAEIGLFKALPNLLENGSSPNIDTVMFGDADVPLLKVAKRGSDVARLAFAMIPTENGVAVVKVGIANHKDQSRMNGVITTAKKG